MQFGGTDSLHSVLLVITEFGQAFITFNTLNKLAQNGVRYATSDIQGNFTDVRRLCLHYIIYNLNKFAHETQSDA